MIIPKEDGKEFRGIGLVKVLGKSTIGIISQQITAAINYNNSLHVFRMGRWTRIAILKAKLLHKLTAMKDVVFHTVFLDLQKAYNDLDRYQDWWLESLVVYDVVHRTLWLLRTYCAMLHMVTKTARYFVPTFQGYCGFT